VVIVTDGTGVPDGDSVEAVFDESVTVANAPFGQFDDVSGFDDVKDRFRRTVVDRIDYRRYGTASVLLFGTADQSPTTRLARGLTGAFGAEYTFFAVDSVVGAFTEGENNIAATLRAARNREPSVVVLDCLDELAFDEEEYERLRHHMDTVSGADARVLVIGTARDDDADLVANDTLFEFVLEVPAPDDQYRQSEIESALQEAQDADIAVLNTDSGTRLTELETHDLSVRDLRTAVKRAIQHCRESGGDPPVTVRPTDIQSALDAIDTERFDEPTTSGFLSTGDTEADFEPDIPDISFRDIGGLDAEKQRLREAVTVPVEYSETFHDAGFSIGQGILLHGPPGNGKTMLAKAVANELDYHFLSVKGPELEQPLVGVSERELRELFQAAREHAPSVVFFDEFDSLAPSRTSDSYEFKDDMVNTLLSELDGLEPLEDVLVLAATNRLDRLDPAVLRSGRFDTFIEVPKPDRADSQAIFEIHAASLPLAGAVSAEWFVALDLPDLSGADIAAVCRKALEFAVAAFDSGERDTLEVTRTDIEDAVEGLRTDPTTDDLPEFR
jgi:SpoVK/Ycf46/Vps4 family AAA+-type ATPase